MYVPESTATGVNNPSSCNPEKQHLTTIKNHVRFSIERQLASSEKQVIIRWRPIKNNRKKMRMLQLVEDLQRLVRVLGIARFVDGDHGNRISKSRPRSNDTLNQKTLENSRQVTYSSISDVELDNLCVATERKSSLTKLDRARGKNRISYKDSTAEQDKVCSLLI